MKNILFLLLGGVSNNQYLHLANILPLPIEDDLPIVQLPKLEKYNGNLETAKEELHEFFHLSQLLEKKKLLLYLLEPKNTDICKLEYIEKNMPFVISCPNLSNGGLYKDWNCEL